MAQFLFNHLFEAKKTGGKRIEDLQNKHADTIMPKERENKLRSENEVNKSEGPQLFAAKLASLVYKNKRMGNIRIKKWEPGAIQVGGGSVSGTIDKEIIPNLDAYLTKAVPQHLRTSLGDIKKAFIGHLNGLVYTGLPQPSSKKTDLSGKRKISRLNASNFVINTPSDDDINVIKAISGTKFKVPSSNDTLISFLKQVTDRVMATLIADGMTPTSMAVDQGLKEFNALRQTVLTGKPENIKFASLTKKSKATTDEERGKLEKELKNEQKAILAYVALVFPFLDPSVSKKIVTTTGNFFPSVGQKYEGVALKAPLNLSDLTDFAGFSSVRNITLKKALQKVRKELLSNPEFKTLADSVGNLLFEAARAESILPLIARKRIAKNIFYSFLAAASPKTLNIAEIDNARFMTSAYNPSNLSINDKIAFISNVSLSLAAEAVKEAEQAPEILSNLRGQNARQALAKSITSGQRAFDAMRGSDYTDKKIAGDALSVDQMIDLGFDQPEGKKIETLFLTWLQSDAYSSTASQELIDQISNMIKEQKTNQSKNSPLKQLKQNRAYGALEALLDDLHALTKEDFDLLKYIKKQLENFDAGLAVAKETDTDEVQSIDDIRNEYDLVFKKFKRRVEDLFKIDPRRHSAMETVLGLSSLDMRLVNAGRNLQAYRRSEASYKRTAAKKATMTKQSISAISALLDTIDLEALFSADEIATILEDKVDKYVHFLIPSRLEAPVSVGDTLISSASSEEEVKDAIMSLVTSKKKKEDIIQELKGIVIPVTQKLSASEAKENLLDYIDSPVIELGVSLSKFTIPTTATKDTLLKELVKYLKTQSIEDSTRIIYSLARLPLKTGPKSTDKEETLSDSSESPEAVARLDALESISNAFSAFSPLNQTILKDATKLQTNRLRRQAALAKINILRQSPAILSGFLQDILQLLQAAPAEVQLALKGIPVNDPQVVFDYVSKILSTLIKDSQLSSLLDIQENTKDFAIGSTASAISSLAERGKAYENSELNPVKSFDSELSPAVNLLINLAASIKTYNGIKLNKDGAPVFDFTFDSTLSRVGFLQMLDTLSSEQSVAANISTSVATKLCVQRYFLSRIAEILTEVSPNLTVNSFIPNEFKKDFPTLVQDIESFIDSVKHGSDEVMALVKSLDDRIISIIGGSNLPLLTKDKNNKIIVTPNEKSIAIPDSSASPEYPSAIQRVAFASLVGIGVSSSELGISKQTALIASFSKVLNDLTTKKDSSVQKFTNALNLIQNLIVIELGKKYSGSDDLISNAIRFIATENASDEDREAIINGVTAIQHLTGSFNSRLYTKTELDKYANARERTNPLINGILGLFSFDNLAEDSNREYEDFARNSFSKENKRDYPGIHKKEEGITKLTAQQLAETLGVAYMDVVKGGRDNIRTLGEAVEGTPESEEPNPVQQAIETAGATLGIDIPSTPVFKQNLTATGSLLQINPKAALLFKSASSRFHGGYMGQTVRDGRESDRLRTIKSYAEYINASKSSAPSVLDTFKRLYDPSLFPSQFKSLDPFFTNVIPNLDKLNAAIKLIGSSLDDNQSLMSTVEGQTRLFTILKQMKPTSLAWTKPDIDSDGLNKKQLKAVTSRPLNPIEQVIKLSSSPDGVEKQFDKIDNRVVTEGLSALLPIILNKTSWKEVSFAYKKLSPKDKRAAALTEFEEYPGAPDPIEVDPNAPIPEPGTPQPQAKRKFLHLYLNDFIQQVDQMVAWIANARAQGKLPADYDFTKNKKFMEIYGTLFSSTTYSIWPEQTGILESLATKLSTVISRENQLQIEAAIKAHPVTNILVSAIYGRDLQNMANPVHRGHLKTISDDIANLWAKIRELKTKLTNDTEKATITRHTNMIKQLHAQINELENENKTMLADTIVRDADNPRNIIGKYSASVAPKTVEESFKLAMSLLSLQEGTTNPTVAKEVASKIYGLLYRSENFRVPSPTDPFTNNNYEFSTFIEAVAPYLYLAPLQVTSETTKIDNFKSIFKISDEMLFILKSGETAAARLTDFTALTSIASHFTPIAMSNPTQEDTEDAAE
jgi:hypothetical protein